MPVQQLRYLQNLLMGCTHQSGNIRPEITMLDTGPAAGGGYFLRSRNFAGGRVSMMEGGTQTGPATVVSQTSFRQHQGACPILEIMYFVIVRFVARPFQTACVDMPAICHSWRTNGQQCNVILGGCRHRLMGSEVTANMTPNFEWMAV